MKNIIIALLGAIALTFIPTNVSAANACEITVKNGETKTINYDLNATYGTNNCHIVNHGNLYIQENAKIRAYEGYAIINDGENSYTEITGGEVTSDIHQAVWVSSGILKITGGTLSSAGGYEENIYSTAKGTLNICGNYSYVSDKGTVNTCATAKVAAPAPIAAQKASTETITITITSSEKQTTAKPAPAPAKTTPVVKSTPAPTRTAPATSTPTVTETKVEEPVIEPLNEVVIKVEGENENVRPISSIKAVAAKRYNNSALEIMLVASVILLTIASTAIITSNFQPKYA